MSRRTTSVVCGLICAILCATLLALRVRSSDEEPADVLPEDYAAALADLRQGNARFVESRRTRSIDTEHDDQWRHHLAEGQHPFAAILCCSDSRVSPEFIFDQRTGAFFEIRNAGNVVDEDVLASMEYAVEHLHVPLLLVIGHESCGAIDAVNSAGDRPLPHHLHALQDHMPDLREEVREGHGNRSPEFLRRLSADNARQQAERLVRESDVIRDVVRSGHVHIFYGLYDLDSGRADVQELPQLNAGAAGSRSRVLRDARTAT